MCDDFMRKLGAQDDIEEDILIGRYTVNTDCLLCGKQSVLVLCDRCAEIAKREQLFSSRGRVEPNQR